MIFLFPICWEALGSFPRARSEAVEWATTLLWLVCFITLVTISPPTHSGIRTRTAPRVIVCLGAIEWYATWTSKRPKTARPYTLPAELT